MKIDIITLFPEMFAPVLDSSIIGRAKQKGIVEVNCVQIRDFSQSKHKNVDDYPYGGGAGMVMQPQPIYDACKSVEDGLVCYLTPKGRKFDQNMAEFLSKQPHISLLCGHYEGVDERVLEEVVDLEISLGDFVLTGGEIPAMAVVDATVRLLDGVLSESQTNAEESFYNGLLEYPQYTRPSEFMGKEVPNVLQSGHHENIANWRREQALNITAEKRPDLLAPKRIGILGGTFNPVHIGHLYIAEKAKQLHNLDEIWFIPVSIPPHKDSDDLAESVHRVNMLQLAINDNQNFRISFLDLQRGGLSYTIDTVRELREKFPRDNFFYIIGEDCDVNTWNQAEELQKLVTFVKLPRELDVSSTKIRDELALSPKNALESERRINSIRYLVPLKVALYIQKHNLYGGNDAL